MPLQIDTPAKRARLTPRRNPYWTKVGGGRGGVSLGYRRSVAGRGAWIAKTTAGGGRAEERLGSADDATEPDAYDDGLSFKAAVAAAIEWSSRHQAAAEEAGKGQRRRPTVRTAVNEYNAARAKRPVDGNSEPQGRLGKHVLSDGTFSGLGLQKLRAHHVAEWRERLQESGALELSSVNRLLNDLRAALNAAALKHRRGLPAHIFQEISIGTKAIVATTNARRQLLSDEQISSAIEAAFDVDDSGDFGRLVLVLAATGARHSQAARLNIADLQPTLGRVMMPGSKKGRSRREKPPVGIPLSADVVDRLLTAAEGRALDDPLLERWSFKKSSRKTSVRTTRRRWGPAYEVDVWWPKVIERAGLPAGTVMYSLRHSSIVRGLKAMLPVRLVAALHDTSIEMIEAHYAAFIVDATEDLARRATLTLPKNKIPIQLAA